MFRLQGEIYDLIIKNVYVFTINDVTTVTVLLSLFFHYLALPLRQCFLQIQSFTKVFLDHIIILKLSMLLISFIRGEDPCDVDRNILDVARRLDTYGITLYPCRVSPILYCSFQVD